MKRHFYAVTAITTLLLTPVGTFGIFNAIGVDAIAAGILPVKADTDSIQKLDTMMVIAPRVEKYHSVTTHPVEIFTAEEITTKAGVAGDISRYIATLPSTVSSLSDNFDNALYVRGGRPSEVVFLVDGIEMENINHFSRANGSGGPVGFINSDFVRKVAFFAGNPPAMYPSRLSSVVAIDLKNGSFSDTRSSVGCRLTGGMLSTEGPFLKGNGSYLCTGRYIDFGTLGNFVKERGIPRLGDCFAKARFLTGNSGELTITGLLSANTFSLELPVAEADDESGLMHWNRSREQQQVLQGGAGCTYISSGVHGTHTITASGSFRDGGMYNKFCNFSDPFFAERYIRNPYRVECDARYRTTLTTSSEFQLRPWLHLASGVRAQYQQWNMSTENNRSHQGEYVYCIGETAVPGELYEVAKSRNIRFRTGEAGGFAELGGELGKFAASLGTRFDYYHLLTAVATAPRLTLSYSSPFGTVTLSAGKQHQFPTEMPTLLLYTYAWFDDITDAQAESSILSALEHMEPLRCYQTSLGFERPFFSWCQFKAELYYKRYNRECHIISPDVQEVFTFNENQQLVFYPQDGKRKSYGIECMVESPIGMRVGYSVGGSLFQVQNRYRDGNWYDDWTNVGYTGSVALQVNPFPGHSFSFTMQGNGGRPYCRETIYQDCLGRKNAALVEGQDYFSDRLDKIMSVNVRYGVKRQFGNILAGVFIEVLNVTNSQPTLEYRFTGDTFTAIKPFGIFPIAGGEITW